MFAAPQVILLLQGDSEARLKSLLSLMSCSTFLSTFFLHLRQSHQVGLPEVGLPDIYQLYCVKQT